MHSTSHQDLKPDNIVLTQDGEAKLIDFGSCLVAGVNEIATPFERDTILGTATYAALRKALQFSPSCGMNRYLNLCTT